MFAHYLFDFDGTLVDSMPTYGAVMLRILDEAGVAYPTDILKIITPLGFAGTADYFVTVLGVPGPAGDLIARMHRYAVAEYTHRIPAKAGVPETLRALKERGASLHVLTASPHASLDPCLRRLGLFDLFDHIWSCEDFGTTKADPAIYRMAAEAIGAPVSDILFLDDNPEADRTARAAGMPVCGVYDDSSREYEEEMRRENAWYVRDMGEVLGI